ncbi:MAG: M23 family metallopeptidase [Lactobacillus amylovorus]|uniref:M23 family metallopeptidase n=1 Tax=Lactobacillus amylovorus TaxID=1604 RepID=UPI00201D3E08|nr:M23 family metallopeptidase [Lactobacillus amylovorus]MCI6761354.1 M23 family metallopeptidase [Lactobacillus johnsonii]MCI7336239.1 M23 family metallopeptidase [Lactobacillus amylovorus]MDY4730542.1 M23 family metallopeptidase [Lactobacillus amylovorus]
MSKAQTFGMTDYMRSVNPPSYFHDGWDFGHSEGGYSPVYAIHEGTVTKVAYDSGLGWFIWVISPDKYVEIYQEGFNNKSDIYVKAGQKIGKLTGSHLHLGLTKITKKYINKK